MEKTDIYIQESQTYSNNMKPKKFTQRHIIIKMLKDEEKEKILKGPREKQVVFST